MISYEKAIPCCISKEKVKDKYANDEKYLKVNDYYHSTDNHRVTAHSIYDLKYSIPNVIPVSYSWLNYDYQYIIKQLAQKF